MRTIVDLPAEQIKALDEYRKKERISRAEALRRAVAAFLPPKPPKRFDFRNHPAFGSWKDREIDSVEYVRKLRDEWEDTALLVTGNTKDFPASEPTIRVPYRR